MGGDLGPGELRATDVFEAPEIDVTERATGRIVSPVDLDDNRMYGLENQSGTEIGKVYPPEFPSAIAAIRAGSSGINPYGGQIFIEENWRDSE